MWPLHRWVVIVQADLPAAQPSSLREIVDAAVERGESMVTDRAGTGTSLLLRPMTGNALEIKRVMTLSDTAYGSEFFTGSRDDSVLVSCFGNEVDGYADISLVARAGSGWAVLTGAALQVLIGEMNTFLGAEGNLALDWNNSIDPAWRQNVRPTQEALWSIQSAA